jgi:predicted  nucleic acid-binding Zn-ribbon protein
MVFTLSMLDVFCCALGCVTLLWLVNQREAMLRAKDNSGLLSTLDVTRSDLKELKSDYTAAVAERDKLKQQVARLRSDLSAANATADRAARELAAMTDKAEDTADRLSKASERVAILTREAADAKSRARELDTALKDDEEKLLLAERRTSELAGRLRESDAAVGRLRASAELVPSLRESAATANERIKSLESDLDLARRAAANVDTEKKDLLNKLARTQAAVDNRFEGIALTGKRVVFLVDMSGSMELVDEKTAAPAKWTGVRDTLLKIFKSLPDLEKYQVVLFSDQLVYPLGNEGRWLDPDPKSADQIQVAMSAMRPKGNTNMYMAFEAAFRYRAAGLDTIYLLSDGLPNVGEGLTADAAARMTETQRSEILSRVVLSALRATWNAAQPSRPRVRINAVGFFYESPDVGAFLWSLARENDGSFVGMSKP